MTLAAWGWDSEWAKQLAAAGDGTEAARVIEQARDRWAIQTQHGPGVARLRSSGRLERYPVVGDWAVVRQGPMPADPWSIEEVLPRRSRFSRGTPLDGATEQVLAANIDVVWIVHGLDSPLNLRRLERYLALAWESGAVPEILLTKSDLATDLEATVTEVHRIAIGVPVRTLSVQSAHSIVDLRATLAPARTVALLGPSGAGKSTLINAIAGSELTRTGAVREHDHKGRHTTTRRSLFQIDGGALLLDTPGLRELRVWDLGEGLEHAFAEIDELASGCRFRDCRHETEPGCAVLEAVETGRLVPARLASFRKLVAEAAFQARKTDARAREAALSEFKAAMKTLKQHHPKYQDPS